MKASDLRCLVVDDDLAWQQILNELLNDCGLAVDIAQNLPEAEGRLRTSVYRLAVVDLSLAGSDHHNRDGLRILDAVRQYQPGCVAVLLTGFANVELAVSALQKHGAYTCLRKESFRRVEFRELINHILALPPPAPLQAASRFAGVVKPAESELQAAGSPAPAAAAPELALVVEDDAGWRSLLSELLAEAGFDVHASSSYGEALGQLKRERYRLAVADLSLASSLQPDYNLDGYRLLASTHKAGIPTIIVSGFADLTLIEQAYAEQKIFACLEKQAFDRRAFLQVVRNALAASPVDAGVEILTERELEVLLRLTQGLTNKEIAGALFITTNTVKRHLKSIFEKMEVNTRAAASARAIRLGIGAVSKEERE